MKKRYLLCLFLLSVFCSTPQNPVNDPANATFSVSVSGNSTRVLAGDSLFLELELTLANFFDSLSIELDDRFDMSLALAITRREESLTIPVVPADTGAGTILLTGYIESGILVEKEIAVTVGRLPYISTDLDSIYEMVAGTPCTLSLEADGDDQLSFAWYKGAAHLSGEDTPTLVITSVSEADAGSYYCAVTDSWGTSYSDTTALSVFSPLAPEGLVVSAVTASSVTLGWQSLPGVDFYRLYRDDASYTTVDPLIETTETTFVDGTDRPRYYWVTAVKDSLESPRSNWVRGGGGIVDLWSRETFYRTLFEGTTDSLDLTDSLLVTGAVLSTGSVAGISLADTLLTLFAGHKSAGTLTCSLFAVTNDLADTAIVVYTIEEKIVTLTLTEGNGTIAADPAGPAYRWGDTVVVTAAPAEEYAFSSWDNGLSGSVNPDTLVLVSDTTLSACFSFAGACTPLFGGGSLNTAVADLREASSRPASLCPRPGLYDNGTIEIHGTVRLVFQKE